MIGLEQVLLFIFSKKMDKKLMDFSSELGLSQLDADFDKAMHQVRKSWIKRKFAGDTLVKGKKKHYRLGSAFSFL
ncbi:MAG: hypothetical protein UT30_C0013G0001 [Candidatus Uhrbacteria bacterium GW2011_GWF2_39_13]|uniref:Uncharacterized protein n=1 Tax=Candidatus Uhrbacteria bacterium GW2011_GWF2_39_13 TaxID=1618995 RepID=A0A0G0Q0W2_9BACT|nr:MAG: hypothetical protein UT30_C0013G0001 [Candidatus Uhrbacteria bacterium GW2011_GWF2_39_13]